MVENLANEGEEVVLQEQEPTEGRDAQGELVQEEREAEEGGVEPKKKGATLQPGETEEQLLRRIGLLTARAKKEEARANALQNENKSLKRRQEVGARPKAPDPNNYTDELGVYDSDRLANDQVKYEDKLHEWRQAQIPTEDVLPIGSEFDDKPELAASEDFWLRAEESRVKHEDFDESLRDAAFTQEMVDAFGRRESGAEIAYFLSKNRAESMRIGNLERDDMLLEIGNLEEKLSGPPSKKVLSGAPPPIRPVEGDAPASGKSEDEMTDKEWFAWKKQEKLKKLKAFP